MITVEKLSYSFPEQDLYKEISFTLEDGQHCALIGSNGTGKTTLIDMIMDTEKYLYDGKIIKDENLRIGYVSQVAKKEKEQDITVFDFLSEEFVRNQEENARLCEEMANSENLEEVFERYQQVLDEFQAMDGDNYETNISKQLKVAGLSKLEKLEISKLSGGEYKLVQVIKQMLMRPGLLIMDEPDVFLDFHNLNGLRDLINSYKGTLLVITHNRYLLNHCFNKILHLENADIQEFDGNYIDYNFSLLLKKIELQELAAKDLEEIERNRKIVERLRADATKVDNATKGRALKAKVSHLARLEARRIKEPFVEIRQPEITLPVLEKSFGESLPVLEKTAAVEEIGENKEAVSAMEASMESKNNVVAGEAREKRVLLSVDNYKVEFEELLLEDVNFAIHEGEKVAIVGPNGTGKTTLLREINKKQNPAIQMDETAEIGFLSQIHGETLNEENTIYEEFEELGFETKAQIAEYLVDYCFEADTLNKKIDVLSGGEKNLLQLAKISVGKANLLLLDEPTSHLDTYSQLALEKAIAEYKGAVLMVSHDFYSIANCVDYVLYVDEKSIRQMRIRTFRKMIYENHFDKKYLELEQKKKELETRIAHSLKATDFESAKVLSEQLEAVIEQMN